MIHALKATAMWLADAVIYLAASLAYVSLILIIVGWHGEAGAWLSITLLLTGVIGSPVLDDWMSAVIHNMTGSCRAMPLLAMLFGIIFGIGAAHTDDQTWHGVALFIIGLVGMFALSDWILPDQKGEE